MKGLLVALPLAAVVLAFVVRLAELFPVALGILGSFTLVSASIVAILLFAAAIEDRVSRRARS